MKKCLVAISVFVLSVFSLSVPEAREWRRTTTSYPIANQSMQVASTIPTTVIIDDPVGDDLNFNPEERVDIVSIEARTDKILLTILINFSADTKFFKIY